MPSRIGRRWDVDPIDPGVDAIHQGVSKARCHIVDNSGPWVTALVVFIKIATIKAANTD
jgi:hypothetical protein